MATVMTEEQREKLRALIAARDARLGPPPAIPRAVRRERQIAEEGRLYFHLPIKGRPRLIDATDKQIRHAAGLYVRAALKNLRVSEMKKLTPEKIAARIEEEAAKMRAERDAGIAARTAQAK